MMYWQRRPASSNQAAPVAEPLQPAVLARLSELRERTLMLRTCQEFRLDMRRLQFARWLVEHGRLGEGV
jgi:hypothetical protein